MFVPKVTGVGFETGMGNSTPLKAQIQVPNYAQATLDAAIKCLCLPVKGKAGVNTSTGGLVLPKVKYVAVLGNRGEAERIESQTYCTIVRLENAETESPLCDAAALWFTTEDRKEFQQSISRCSSMLTAGAQVFLETVVRPESKVEATSEETPDAQTPGMRLSFGQVSELLAESGLVIVSHIQLSKSWRESTEAISQAESGFRFLCTKGIRSSDKPYKAEEARRLTPEGAYLRAAAICINGPDVLLVRRRGDAKREGHQKWGLPGGGLDSGEYAHTSAQREALEEGGVIGSVDKELGNFDSVSKKKGTPISTIAFVLSVSQHLPEELWSESLLRERKWVPFTEENVMDLISKELDQRMLLKALSER